MRIISHSTHPMFRSLAVFHYIPRPAYILLHSTSVLVYLSEGRQANAMPTTTKCCPNLHYITWELIFDTADVGGFRTAFVAPPAIVSEEHKHVQSTVERISRTEDDRTFIHVGTVLASNIGLQLGTMCSQFFPTMYAKQEYSNRLYSPCARLCSFK